MIFKLSQISFISLIRTVFSNPGGHWSVPPWFLRLSTNQSNKQHKHHKLTGNTNVQAAVLCFRRATFSFCSMAVDMVTRSVDTKWVLVDPSSTT